MIITVLEGELPAHALPVGLATEEAGRAAGMGQALRRKREKM